MTEKCYVCGKEFDPETVRKVYVVREVYHVGDNTDYYDITHDTVKEPLSRVQIDGNSYGLCSECMYPYFKGVIDAISRYEYYWHGAELIKEESS